MEHYGCSVKMLPQPPAVRPPIDYGMLGYAKKQILKAVEQLSPHVRRVCR